MLALGAVVAVAVVFIAVFVGLGLACYVESSRARRTTEAVVLVENSARLPRRRRYFRQDDRDVELSSSATVSGFLITCQRLPCRVDDR